MSWTCTTRYSLASRGTPSVRIGLRACGRDGRPNVVLSSVVSAIIATDSATTSQIRDAWVRAAAEQCEIAILASVSDARQILAAVGSRQ